MPSGGAAVSCSTDVSAVRAAKTQWSPTWKLDPLKETVTPCSSTTVVADEAGTVMTPEEPGVRLSRLPPAPDLICPFWSQRRTRRCRVAASATDSCRSAGSDGVNVRVPSSSCTSANRISPGWPVSSRWSSRISTQSPSANPSTTSLPSDAGRTPSPPASTSTTGLATEALSRDHVKVAVPSPPAVCTSIR